MPSGSANTVQLTPGGWSASTRAERLEPDQFVLLLVAGPEQVQVQPVLARIGSGAVVKHSLGRVPSGGSTEYSM